MRDAGAPAFGVLSRLQVVLLCRVRLSAGVGLRLPLRLWGAAAELRRGCGIEAVLLPACKVLRLACSTG